MGKFKVIKMKAKYHASSGPDQNTKEMDLLVPEHSVSGMTKKDNQYEIYLTSDCIASLFKSNIIIESAIRVFKEEDLEIL